MHDRHRHEVASHARQRYNARVTCRRFGGVAKTRELVQRVALDPRPSPGDVSNTTTRRTPSAVRARRGFDEEMRRANRYLRGIGGRADRAGVSAANSAFG